MTPEHLLWERVGNRSVSEPTHEAVRRLGSRLAIWLSLSMVVVGCSVPSSPAPTEMEGALREGLCLVQLRSERIEIVQLDGGWREHRIPTKEGATRLSWGRVSPDALYAVGSDGTDLVGVALDGRQLWQLKGASVSGMPAISSDAKKIAFAGDGQRLAVYEVSAGELRKLDVSGDHPSWTPSGDRLAYDDRGQVRVYDLVRAAGFELGRGTEPSWSPDGTSVAVRVGSGQVDLVNVQTRERRVLIEASSLISVPRWSPNGEWMMYTRRGPRHWWSKPEWTGSEPSQILIRQVKTGTETSVGEFYKANPGDYTWVSNRELCRATPATR
jgi:hypothetical protein